jgi:biopolymer transport protein ExbD
MNFRRGRVREEPDINLIPLIDILIVILIFLFLTTTYSRFAELQINLPEASAERAKDQPQMLSVAVDAQGKYAINGATAPFGSPAAFAQGAEGRGQGREGPGHRDQRRRRGHAPVRHQRDGGGAARRIQPHLVHDADPPLARRGPSRGSVRA